MQVGTFISKLGDSESFWKENKFKIRDSDDYKKDTSEILTE